MKTDYLSGLGLDPEDHGAILEIIADRPKTYGQIKSEYEERRGEEVSKPTLYRKLSDLQERNLATKNVTGKGEDRAVFYAVTDWKIFYEGEFKPLRRQAKRNLFKKVEDRKEAGEYCGVKP